MKCKGGDSRQLHPGARVHCCRCSLPGLTGFTVYRRGRTNGNRHCEAHMIQIRDAVGEFQETRSPQGARHTYPILSCNREDSTIHIAIYPDNTPYNTNISMIFCVL